MYKVVGVRFSEVGKIHYFVIENIKFGYRDKVICQTKRGIECGTVMYVGDGSVYKNIVIPDERIIRKATKLDLKSLQEIKKDEKKAREICEKKIVNHKLNMKLVDVEYMFDRSKVIFYFVAESRVDFRALVKDLAFAFKVRIELRQIGIRDQSKMIGGLGPCGKSLCCASFLNDFKSVSIKMAKDQNLPLNPIKLSGTCGRLMCCIEYEQNFYHEAVNKYPQAGERVATSEGTGVIISSNVISGEAKVLLDKLDSSVQPKVFRFSEIKMVK